MLRKSEDSPSLGKRELLLAGRKRDAAGGRFNQQAALLTSYIMVYFFAIGTTLPAIPALLTERACAVQGLNATSCNNNDSWKGDDAHATAYDAANKSAGAAPFVKPAHL